MAATLFVGPAACGKTQYVLDRVRRDSDGLRAEPIICVPTSIQVRSAARRLATDGGVLGVRVVTFDHLCDAVLARSPSRFVELADEVKYRLMRDVIEALARSGQLRHFGPIADKPGFIEEVLRLVAELKGARIDPTTLQALWVGEGAAGRLLNLAAIYLEWQERLRAGDWSDRAGNAWLAVDAVEQGRITPPTTWSPVVFDGFDNFTEIQLALITALAARPQAEVIVTLTGDPDDRGDAPTRTVHGRFHATRRIIEATLGIEGQRLPVERPRSEWQPALLHLRDTFRVPGATQVPGDGAVEYVEASSRALEVRAALRWLKMRILRDNLPIHECGLVARNIQPYLLLVDQVAAEFGLPVQIEDGLPLRTNPAVASLLKLLHVMLPGDDGLPSLPRRPLIELWRSPYFDLADFQARPGDADLLDVAARLALVAGGLAEWSAAFDFLSRGAPNTPPVEAAHETIIEAEEPFTAGLPRDEARRLGAVFTAFANRMTPLASATVEEHVRWLEEIIGPDIEANEFEESPAGADDVAPSLKIMAGIRGGESHQHPTVQRDEAAMRKFKEVLRGLIWAEEVVGAATQTYAAFVSDLTAAVETLNYKAPSADESIFVGATVQARGVPLRLLAVIGMAEGELPSRLGEDPFLHETDRTALRRRFPGVKSSTESTEAEFFLDTIPRPRDALLLVRPRITATGAVWEPSTYWHDVRAHVEASPEIVALGHPVAPARAASMSELLEAMAVFPLSEGDPLNEAVAQSQRDLVSLRARTLSERARGAASPCDGDLTAEAADLRYPVDHVWSATALETYRSCPFQFFVQKRLQVEARAEPDDGPSAAHMGTLYHRIMQNLYSRYVDAAEPPPLDDLLAALPSVAGEILANGPAAEGFRAPPSWKRKCDDIIENVRRSVTVLAEIGGTPIGLEYFFGGDRPFMVNPPRSPALSWPTENGAPIPLSMRGAIDRIDRMADGSILIIDYKTGTSGYERKNDLINGKKLQLAIYSLAANQVVAGNQSVKASYFFVHKGEAATWSLTGTAEDPDSAVIAATERAGEAVAGIRSGHFVPRAPAEGCPSYCAASAFCWHSAPKSW